MEILHFQPKHQQVTEAFLNTIYREMGWVDQGGELTNLYNYFHLPHDGFFLLAREDAKIIGTAGSLRLNDKEAVMKRFYIHTNHRGTGVAKKLLEEFIKNAKAMNITRIVLDVSKNNKRAIRFYEKNGFVRYYQNPIPGWNESLQPATYYYYFLNI